VEKRKPQGQDRKKRAEGLVKFGKKEGKGVSGGGRSGWGNLESWPMTNQSLNLAGSWEGWGGRNHGSRKKFS